NILPQIPAVSSYFLDTKAMNASGTSVTVVKGRSNMIRSKNPRRHAGSFSLRDVEIGRSMSSPPPDVAGHHKLPGPALEHSGHDRPLEMNHASEQSPT